MKHRIFLITKLLAIVLAIAACVFLYLLSINYFAPHPTVGYIHSEREMPYLDLDELYQQLETSSTSLVEADASQGGYLQAAQQLVEQNAKILVVSQDTDTVDNDLLNFAQANGLGLILVGRSPSEETMQQYDKMWYVGSSPALGGELLGSEITTAWERGTVVDRNADHLLQYFVYLSKEGSYYNQMIDSTLLQCEHYGVFSQCITYLDENQQPLVFSAEQLSGQEKPELLLVTHAQDARLVFETAQQLGWLEGDTPTQIAALAENQLVAQQLMADDICFAVSYYDTQAITRAVVSVALNGLDSTYAGEDLSIQPDESGRFWIPFGLLANAEDQQTPSE